MVDIATGGGEKFGTELCAFMPAVVALTAVARHSVSIVRRDKGAGVVAAVVAGGRDCRHHLQTTETGRNFGKIRNDLEGDVMDERDGAFTSYFVVVERCRRSF